MDADSAPHPFTTLMPDSVEQSSDANECVCLQEGLQTTVVEGPDSAEEHSLLGTAASSGLPLKLQNREKKAYVIHERKNQKLKIWSLSEICLNYIKFPPLPQEADALEIGWKQTVNLHQNIPLFQRFLSVTIWTLKSLHGDHYHP